MALRLYQAASAAGSPFAPQVLARRLNRGKEHPERLAERRGEASLPRPQGPLIWVHGASVGEMLAAVPLIEKLRAQNFTVLVTSGTVTSAALAEQRLPDGAFHQFIPLDAPRFVRRFLQHWQPSLALFVESDLWPNLILSCAERRIPMIVINGRLSERSYSRWRRVPGVIAALLSRFDLCLTQSAGDAERYSALGAPRVTSTGNLKLDVPAPPVDNTALRRLRDLIGKRPVIAAASTHAGEETAVVAAHRRLRAKFPDLLTIIAPRHPQRGESITEIVKVAGLVTAQRSQGGEPTPETGVYVADTLGELGLFYRLAPIVFMGGSLVTHGGQNPIEAIRLGAAVVHGPHVANFAELYATLDTAHGAQQVADEEGLTTLLGDWLSKGTAREAVATAGVKTVETLGGALKRTLAALDPYLMQLRLEQQGS
ncbi:MAG TPA: 3-deoxy-D-manno-octulosonic acid transferase [Xanthobacteraceae bacterium]|jgi:3-deoxy-D-manno-octulosonic-acid transferase|nr:3-deoxy-D-manno-octulosonic acid transferase [Xanthobacteraceae bacterium]